MARALTEIALKAKGVVGKAATVVILVVLDRLKSTAKDKESGEVKSDKLAR